MNREFLKSLGLEDEAIEKIMTEHGKSLNDYKDKADKHDGLVTQVDDLKKQLKGRDTQLEGLKKVDADALQKTIDDLQEANKTQKTEYEEKLQQQAFEHKLESTLSGEKVKNIKAVKALLDLDAIKLDGDKLLGLDDQMNSLKESESYLFEQEEKPNTPQIVTPGNPNGGSGTAKSLADMSYQELSDLKTNNPAQFAELIKQ